MNSSESFYRNNMASCELPLHCTGQCWERSSASSQMPSFIVLGAWGSSFISSLTNQSLLLLHLKPLGHHVWLKCLAVFSSALLQSHSIFCSCEQRDDRPGQEFYSDRLQPAHCAVWSHVQIGSSVPFLQPGWALSAFLCFSWSLRCSSISFAHLTSVPSLSCELVRYILLIKLRKHWSHSFFG